MPRAEYFWTNVNGTRVVLTQDDEYSELLLEVYENDTLMAKFALSKTQSVQLAQALAILVEFI